MASLPSGVAALGSDHLPTFPQPELSSQLQEGLLPVSAEMGTWECAGHHGIPLAAGSGQGMRGALLFPLCESTLPRVDAVTATKALPVSCHTWSLW